jgi:hypothetical protein
VIPQNVNFHPVYEAQIMSKLIITVPCRIMLISSIVDRRGLKTRLTHCTDSTGAQKVSSTASQPDLSRKARIKYYSCTICRHRHNWCTLPHLNPKCRDTSNPKCMITQHFLEVCSHRSRNFQRKRLSSS